MTRIKAVKRVVRREVRKLAASSQLPESGPEKLFDELSRAIASPVSRRHIFKLALVGIAGVFLNQLGIRPSWATTTCSCGGAPIPQGQACCQSTQLYDPATHCCTPSGVQQKHPIVDLAACPNRVPHPGHVPGDDGTCTGVPDSFGAADFLPCCIAHDHCYDTCNNAQAACDGAFHTCLQGACQAAYGAGAPRRLNACLRVADAYFNGVQRFGTRFYEAAQRNACDCCAGDQPCCPSGRVMCGEVCCDPGQTCENGQCSSGSCPNPGTCGSAPACGDGSCVCFLSVEGTGFCHRGQPCAGSQSCTSSSQCPAGYVCSTITCCGPQGICIQPCTGTQATEYTAGPTTVG